MAGKRRRDSGWLGFDRYGRDRPWEICITTMMITTIMIIIMIIIMATDMATSIWRRRR